MVTVYGAQDKYVVIHNPGGSNTVGEAAENDPIDPQRRRHTHTHTPIK